MNNALNETTRGRRPGKISIMIGGFALASIVLLASATAFAISPKTNKIVTAVGAELKAYNMSGGGIFIKLQDGTTGESCGVNDWALIPIGTSFPSSSQQHSIALAAFLSGRSVDVTLIGCLAPWTGASTYPVVQSISIH